MICSITRIINHANKTLFFVLECDNGIRIRIRSSDPVLRYPVKQIFKITETTSPPVHYCEIRK